MTRKAVILAGGVGTRIRAYYPNTIKSLIEFGGKPFIYYQLQLLKKNHFPNVVICAGYGAEELEKYISSVKWGMDIRISKDGDIPLGTGGAIKKAVPLLGYDFLVLYGDSYLDFDYQKAKRKYLDSRKPAMLTIYHNKNQFDKSNIEYDGKTILSFDKENPSPNAEYIDYGAGFYHASLFRGIPEETFDLSVIQKKLIEYYKLVEVLEIKDRFYEIGSLQGIADFQKMMEEKSVFSRVS